ncbi:MAG: ArsR family transcriptional regulator [Saprospiraceae bacterium]
MTWPTWPRPWLHRPASPSSNTSSVNACVCGDLVDEPPLAQATVSQHLRELKAAGLIKGNIEGTSVCLLYRLRPVEDHS